MLIVVHAALAQMGYAVGITANAMTAKPVIILKVVIGVAGRIVVLKANADQDVFVTVLLIVLFVLKATA